MKISIKTIIHSNLKTVWLKGISPKGIILWSFASTILQTFETEQQNAAKIQKKSWQSIFNNFKIYIKNTRS